MKYFIKYKRFNMTMILKSKETKFVNTDDLEKWWDEFSKTETVDMSRCYAVKLTDVLPLPEVKRTPNTGPR